MVENENDYIGPVAVRAIMDALTETKNNDIILGSEGKNTREIPYVVGVDKVLTSISTNRN